MAWMTSEQRLEYQRTLIRKNPVFLPIVSVYNCLHGRKEAKRRPARLLRWLIAGSIIGAIAHLSTPIAVILLPVGLLAVGFWLNYKRSQKAGGVSHFSLLRATRPLKLGVFLLPIAVSSLIVPLLVIAAIVSVSYLVAPGNQEIADVEQQTGQGAEQDDSQDARPANESTLSPSAAGEEDLKAGVNDLLSRLKAQPGDLDE
jgi:hypothetical protein